MRKILFLYLFLCACEKSSDPVTINPTYPEVEGRWTGSVQGYLSLVVVEFNLSQITDVSDLSQIIDGTYLVTDARYSITQTGKVKGTASFSPTPKHPYRIPVFLTLTCCGFSETGYYQAETLDSTSMRGRLTRNTSVPSDSVFTLLRSR